MRTARTALATTLGAVSLLAGALALAAPAAADTTPACADGVTVVVDASDIGGEAVTGCAEGDPATGTEALESAGFAITTDDSGLICAIDAQPDPCPTEFEGSYWSYWQVVDGEWVSSQVGADASDPAPGGVEGWRYNDGSVPPPLPGDDEESSAAATEATTTPESTDDATSSAATDQQDDAGGISPAIWVVVAVVVIGVVVGFVIRRRAGATR